MDLVKRGYGPRAAFTLIEVIVAVGILALLLCLILPAVQAAREAGRRMQCASNLHQIGIALSGYEATHRMFPPGRFNPSLPNVGLSVNNYSVITHLLSYMDQQIAYSSFNFSFHAFDSPNSPVLENSTARSTMIGILLCPSDTEANHRNSYCFNYGTFDPGNLLKPYNGPFALGTIPSTSVITDGLSNTAFVSERIGGSYNKALPDLSRDMKIPMSWSGHRLPPDEVYIQYCLNAPAKSWLTIGGRYWCYANVGQTFYNHNGSPNDSRVTCGGEVFGLLPPRSRHSSLVNVLFGDGHLTAIQNSVDHRVWASSGTCASMD